MRPRRVIYRESFFHALEKIPEAERPAIFDDIQKFIDRSAEHALRPEHKRGSDCWAFRVNRGDRVFYFQQDDEQGKVNVLFHVGRHDDYRVTKKKRWGR